MALWELIATETAGPDSEAAMFIFGLAFAEASGAEILCADFSNPSLAKMVDITNQAWPSEYSTQPKAEISDRVEKLYEFMPRHSGLRLFSPEAFGGEPEDLLNALAGNFKVVSFNIRNVFSVFTDERDTENKIYLLENSIETFNQLQELEFNPIFAHSVLVPTSKPLQPKKWQAEFPRMKLFDFRINSGTRRAVEFGYGVPRNSNVFRCAKNISKEVVW
ncbi:MAG: hypothetical protein RL038_655 [Actinomycetota bacterium]